MTLATPPPPLTTTPLLLASRNSSVAQELSANGRRYAILFHARDESELLTVQIFDVQIINVLLYFLALYSELQNTFPLAKSGSLKI